MLVSGESAPIRFAERIVRIARDRKRLDSCDRAAFVRSCEQNPTPLFEVITMKSLPLSCIPALAGLALGSAAFGQFSMDPAASYLAGTQPSGMAAGDFDGDGDMDLATTVDGPDRVIVLLNNGIGIYALGPATLLGSGTSPQDCVAARFNGDAMTDLVVTLRDPVGTVRVLTATGGGAFALGASATVGDRPIGLSVADHDADGDMDVAVANRDGGTASVLTNTGAAFTVQALPAAGEPRSTAFGDFDGDGDRDLAVTEHDGRRVLIFTNTGGAFAQTATLFVSPLVRPDGITAADVSGDCIVDLAVATSDQTLGINQAAIFLNAAGVFSGPFAYNTGGVNTSGIVAADFNCDDIVDVATSNQDSNNVSLLPGTGAGAFGPATLVTVGTTPEEIATADLDGDGDADIATANRDSNNVSVIMNRGCAPAVPGDATGDGLVGFPDLLQILSNWGPCCGCPADVTGNGIVDFADLLLVLSNWS
jgi:hypothetical protein